MITIHTYAQKGDIEGVIQELRNGIDINSVNSYGNTPLMCAIEMPQNNSAMVRFLIDQGANVNAVNDFGFTALMEAAQAGATEIVRWLLEVGARPDYSGLYGERAIASATNLEIVRMLVASGEDLKDINDQMHQLLLGLDTSGELHISKEKYFEGRHYRFGRSNPEVMNIEFWQAMVRSGVSAYTARTKFQDSFATSSEPIWCFQRYGRTITELPDGRFVEIGGEHEDSYDPDFCIYNDVVVHDGDDTFQILGYPRTVFPPTDFHSATLVDQDIYLIGRLGYWGLRDYGQTPVFRLNCATWQIEKIETSGENPGWISRHHAVLRDEKLIHISQGKLCLEVEQKEQYIDNTTDYILDLTTRRWKRLTD